MLSTKCVLSYKYNMVTRDTEITETNSEQDTIAFAQKFAKNLKSGDIVFLQGDLGAGKSVFARAIIRTLCDDMGMEVPSPTFTLVQTYDASLGAIWHFDLYRLSDVSEVYELGWEEALGEGLLLIEWPERLGYLVPDQYVEVNLSIGDKPDDRVIEVICHD